MSRRTGLEAEAINHLTDSVQPPAMRAILVQRLTRELVPSVAISRLLAEGGAATVRAAIDDVTHRAATISRARDVLVHDRVDELTQVFIENVAGLADVSKVTTSSRGPERHDRRTFFVLQDPGIAANPELLNSSERRHAEAGPSEADRDGVLDRSATL